MTRLFRWTLGTLAVVLLVNSAVWAQRQEQRPAAGQQLNRVLQGQAAQQGQQPQARTTLKAVQGRQGETVADHQVATWLILSNEVEVRLAQTAAKQSHTDSVKQFAQKMIDEHTEFLNNLRQFAPDAPTLGVAEQRTDVRDDGKRDDAQRTPAAPQTPGTTQAQNQAQPQPGRVQQPAGENPQARPTVREGQFAQGGQANQQGQRGLPMNEICYQMAARTLNSQQQELSHKQGSEFDMCYIGGQIHEHMAMLDTLNVLRPYASGQLAGLIDRAIPSTQQHLAEAKKIGEQLWGKTAEQSQTGRQEDQDRPKN